jgi:autotransporter-associated beta strand protein
VVNGGTLQLDSVTAPGSGAILVNAGASLNLGANITNPITIAGGTLGSSAAGLAVPGAVIVTANSTVETYNAGSGAGSNDVILTGPLLGTGDINLLSINGNAPDSQAFRLRGPSSDYSGTITVNQSAKFELQNGGATGSPMGTGTLVMVGGTPTGTAAAGTFSLVNLRNNSGGTTTFGNNVRISGAGSAFFNMVGSSPAGSLTAMGDLQIGSGQTAAAVSTAAAHTLGFSTVTLTGGVATFTPQIAGNTNYIAVNNIQLGAISETTPGSGITMNGVATLTLTGANTYTGSTSLLSGTTVLASGASLNNTSSITVAQSAAFNTQAVGTFAVGTIQSLTVNGTLTGSVSIAGALRGSGIVNGTVASITGGLVAPGNSAGTLTTKNIDLGSGSGLQMELSKLIAGSPPIAGLDYDQIVATDDTFAVSPTVTLGANLVLTVGAGIQVGDVFTLILNQSGDDVVGTFEGLAQGQVFTAGGQQFRISYADNAITPAFELSGGNDVSLIVVPEPASAALLLGGAALISASRRRSKCTATR